MSDIKIKPSATGSATVTLTAPATGTARTVTLPDSTDTLAVNSDVTNKLPLAGGTLTGNLIAGGEIKVGTSDNGKITSTFALTLDPPTGEPIVFRSAGTDIARFRPGGGLCFGTDTTAANALDDYEEGTHASSWTTGNSGSISMGRNSMSYTKIGRVVTIVGEMLVNSVSSPIGGVRVSLPFAIAAHSADRNMTTMTRPGMYHVPHHQDNPPLFMIPANQNVIEGVYEQDDGSFTDYNVAAGEQIYFGFSYLTT